MGRVSVVLSVVWSSLVFAQGGTVVLCAPPPLRAAFLAEITANGKTALDLSELDTALYGPDGAKLRLAAGKRVTLPTTLPKEVRADFAKGEATCRAREQQGADARLACAEHLVCAIWERHLERLGVERVIEAQAYPMVDGAMDVVTYRPGEVTVAGGVTPPPWSPASLAKQLVPPALRGTLRVSGTRPSTRVLPGPKAPPVASLSQGAPQSLPAVGVPPECKLERGLVLEPASAPLAVTIANLWRTSLGSRLREGAEPLRCTLELEGGSQPDSLAFRCRESELTRMRLFGSTTFGDPTFQAAVARLLVATQLHFECDPPLQPKP